MLRKVLLAAVAGGAMGSAALASGVGDGLIINDQLNATPVTGNGNTIVDNRGFAAIANPVQGITEASGNIVSMQLGGVWSDRLDVRNSQINGHGIEASNYTDVRWANRRGTVESSAAARANAAQYDINADRPTAFNNFQSSGPVGDTVPHAFRGLSNINNTSAKNIVVTHESGAVSGSAIALDNLASVAIRGQVDSMNNVQMAESRKTTAFNNADVYWAKGDVNMVATAGQNLFAGQVETDAAHFAPSNIQKSWRGTVDAKANLVANGVHGNISNAADATANVYQIDLKMTAGGDAALRNDQRQFGMVKSSTFVDAKMVEGNLDNATIARANVYTANVADAEHVTFKGYQSARNDPRATSNVIARGVEGDLNNLTLAAANTTSISAPGAGIIGGITNRQLNQAVTATNSSVYAQNIGGSISNISSSIGNSFSFSNRAAN